MLDAGGGGGFYARAFEELGYGESTSVDLDPEACDFARELGVKTVICADLEDETVAPGPFDFIFCRHLLEHLLDPAAFLDKLMARLGPNGCLLLSTPNGRSLEYLAYPFSNLRSRLIRVWRSNPSGSRLVLRMICGRSMLHGMDPPRHLWALTEIGLRRFLESRGVKNEIATFPLGDPIFSPFVRRSPLLIPFLWLGQWVTSRARGGTHLVCLVEKASPVNRETGATLPPGTGNWTGVR